MSGRERMDSDRIAKLAGVSRATVSRVINRPELVKPETRRKVMDVIGQFSYSPNLSAQVLAGKRLNTIGVFVASYSSSKHLAKESVHADFMLSRILNTASSLGFYVMVSIVNNFDKLPPKLWVKEFFTQSRVDGGIFMGFPNHYPPVEELIAEGYVVGVFDQFVPGRSEPNRVVVRYDDEAFEQPIEHLYGLGHRRIAALHGDMARFSSQQKHEAYARVMSRYGLDVPPDYQIFTGFNQDTAYEQVLRLARDRETMPTAYCCASDDLAFRVIDALGEAGLSVPEDVSVVGYDDSLMSRYVTPPLTTMQVDFEAMLSELTIRVIECIRRPRDTQFAHAYPSTMVIRSSCAPPPV